MMKTKKFTIMPLIKEKDAKLLPRRRTRVIAVTKTKWYLLDHMNIFINFLYII